MGVICSNVTWWVCVKSRLSSVHFSLSDKACHRVREFKSPGQIHGCSVSGSAAGRGGEEEEQSSHFVGKGFFDPTMVENDAKRCLVGVRWSFATWSLCWFYTCTAYISFVLEKSGNRRFMKRERSPLQSVIMVRTTLLLSACESVPCCCWCALVGSSRTARAPQYWLEFQTVIMGCPMDYRGQMQEVNRLWHVFVWKPFSAH